MAHAWRGMDLHSVPPPQHLFPAPKKMFLNFQGWTVAKWRNGLAGITNILVENFYSFLSLIFLSFFHSFFLSLSLSSFLFT